MRKTSRLSKVFSYFPLIYLNGAIRQSNPEISAPARYVFQCGYFPYYTGVIDLSFSKKRLKVSKNLSTINFPDMAFVKQKLYRSEISDISGGVASSLGSLPAFNATSPGDTVAVAVGSRGISKIDSVVCTCLQFLKEKGLNPFIVPAMGSHGGATEEGQREVLAKLGITENSIGAPIVADMDTECIGEISCGLKIFISKKALEADHIVVINRVKPHTKFRADIESGLCKMLAIGLGKAKGVAEFHRCAVNHGFRIIEDAANTVLNKCRILFGLALTEDGYSSLAHIEAVMPGSFIEREKNLLKKSSAMMGRIPFDYVDVLIIDFIGKNISGIGMDSNITGRHRDITGDFHTAPHVKRIFVRDLSPDSDGNGNGIGLADVTTKRLVEALDYQKTYINALSAISPEKAAIPIHFPNDRKSLEACLLTIGPDSPDGARIVRIKDTASLEILQVSNALEQDILANKDLKQITPWQPVQFDKDGNLSEISVKINIY